MKHENMISFRLAQIWVLCQFALAYVISLFYKQKEIWVVCERGVDARDNGYWFFKYLREQHPEIEAYYLISSKSVDYNRLLPYAEKIVEFGSMSHYIMLWRASILISAHVQGYFPFRGLGLWLKKVCPTYRRKKHINLKHGITCNYSPYLEYNNTTLDALFSASPIEYDYFITKYHYPPQNVFLTGFCRYDNLNQYETKPQILLMPTWREWLYKDNEVEESDYVQEYLKLLSNNSFHQLLEEYRLTLFFYPHHEMQRYLHVFNRIQNPRIVIADKNDYDVQQLLKESKLLITDYSSVFFDFAYMNKPILFYQFDKERFRKEHYEEGWYSYEKGLGPVARDQELLLHHIKGALLRNCTMEPQYVDYTKQLFAYRDSNNCERIFKIIVNL